jgi:TonB family protein
LPELPEQFLESKFKGSASVELILDESGPVLHASVRDASHKELEAPSIEATKNWKFEPSMIDGNPVKS